MSSTESGHSKKIVWSIIYLKALCLSCTPSSHFIHPLPPALLSLCLHMSPPLCVYPPTHHISFYPSFSLAVSLHFSDLHVEGLFRVPGHSLRQAALREMLNAGAEIDLEAGGFHPNDAATLLKSYLGELPEPLLTHRHYHVHLKVGGIDLDSRFSPITYESYCRKGALCSFIIIPSFHCVSRVDSL